MLRFALLAVGAAVIVAIGLVLWPTGGSRPDSHLAGPAATAPDPSTFVVHDAAPPAQPAPGVAPPTTPPTAGDLDAVMQRLREAAAQKQAAQAGTPPAPAPGLTVTAPAPSTPVGTPALPPVTPPAAPGTTDAGAPPPNRWTNVTGQGTRWRMVRSGIGYTVSIDLGGGQVADVHVLPAFANLDPASINVRVDYLRDTILQSFSSQSASYSFARDGSVALEH